MSAHATPSDPYEKPPRPSFFRRWFGWLFLSPPDENGAGGEPGGNSSMNANDAYFASVAAGDQRLETPDPTDPAIPVPSLFPAGLKPSRKPPSPLAKAYADAAATAASASSAESASATAAPGEGPDASAAPRTPEWKIREPEDPSDPTPHEAQQYLTWDDWSLMAGSLRGKLHAHQALWRDDAFLCERQGPWTLIAVADGAGSASLSRIGAQRSCEAAIASLKESLAGISFPEPMPETLSPSDVGPVKAALVAAGRRAQEAITREAERRCRPSRDFHTTLLLAVHLGGEYRDLVSVLQVGDGTVGLYTARGTCSILGVADHGSFASETRFLTMAGIEEEFESRVRFALVKGMSALAVMTDGVADDFFPEAQRLGELFDGQPIRDLKTPEGGDVPGLLLEAARNPRQGQSLIDWLRYEKKGSSDDRTLALLFRTPHVQPSTEVEKSLEEDTA
jgi:serine/threonine protein phosphatase PrpC